MTEIGKVIDWDLYTDWALGILLAVVVAAVAGGIVVVFVVLALLLLLLLVLGSNTDAIIAGDSVVIICWFGFWFLAFALLILYSCKVVKVKIDNDIKSTIGQYFNLLTFVRISYPNNKHSLTMIYNVCQI